MQSNNILLNEAHHASILVSFYNVLEKTCGHERGLEIFMTAARAYGRRRGRRMAMRALRDGNPLDMTSYFAYGELLSTEGAYKGYYTASPGMVHEHQDGCPWATEFHASCFQCGVEYCREIDNSVIRGFNPNLEFSCPQNMHLTPACDFYYGGAEITPDFMETYASRVPAGSVTKREMAYHCADVYQMFCHITTQVLPTEGEGIVAEVRAQLSQKYGEAFLPALDRFEGKNFERIDE
jgi:hypothetical protein